MRWKLAGAGAVVAALAITVVTVAPLTIAGDIAAALRSNEALSMPDGGWAVLSADSTWVIKKQKLGDWEGSVEWQIIIGESVRPDSMELSTIDEPIILSPGQITDATLDPGGYWMAVKSGLSPTEQSAPFFFHIRSCRSDPQLSEVPSVTIREDITSIFQVHLSKSEWRPWSERIVDDIRWNHGDLFHLDGGGEEVVWGLRFQRWIPELQSWGGLSPLLRITVQACQEGS